MADRVEPEIIPDPDFLLCRVHHTQFNFKENRIMSVVFSKVDQSADWSKYSTEEESVARHKTPEQIKAVVSITAGACRELDQEVIHDPVPAGQFAGPNQAHSEIRGAKPKLVQSKLRDAISRLWENPRFTGSLGG